MELIRSTEIWKSTLGAVEGEQGNSKIVRRLEQSFVLFRDHALQFARHLPQDLRQLTVHDETHSDALWEVFDVLFPPAMIANPLEAYVLGGSFLIHDLGHALCMYPNGLEQLKKTKAWQRAIQMAARVGGNAESILENAIRLNHASHAQTLAVSSFGEGKYLIDDAELRIYLGPTIGKVAFSHWWDHKKVNESPELARLGAIPLVDCPGSWTVDPRKLAYILRACDACQIDGRRAPLFAEPLRKPTGIAANHWGAQRTLTKPFESDGKIHFTSVQPFGVDAINSWWTAYDLMLIANLELKEAESYFATHSIRPKVNQVAGSTSPRAFSRFVAVDGWEPVETRPTVSSVTKVISRLGGVELYGFDMIVPLRELIQNSRDAIIARRLVERKPENWGEIRVQVTADESKAFLTISDNGIGMSERTILKYLLDFGTSYWQSNDCGEDLPELNFETFNPVGMFGIGFFSVFMLGTKVKVITRTLNDGRNQTRVLEFLAGLEARPLLRPATSEEQLSECGTSIEIELTNKDVLERIHTPKHERLEPLMRQAVFRRRWSLAEALAWECPACDVDIIVQEEGADKVAVSANDWITMSAEELFRRIFLHRDDIDQILRTARSQYHLCSLEQLTHPSGKIVGRASLIDNRTQLNDSTGLYGIVTSGPFRASMNMLTPGILIGTPKTACRNDAEPIAFENYHTTSVWATSQAKHAKTSALFNDLNYRSGLAAYVRSFCGDMSDLAVYHNRGKVVSLNEIVCDGLDFPEILLFPLDLIDHGYLLPDFDSNNPTHIGVSMGRMTNGKLLMTDDPLARSSHPLWNQYWYSLWGAAIEAISQAWKCNLTSLLNNATNVHVDGLSFIPAIVHRPT